MSGIPNLQVFLKENKATNRNYWETINSENMRYQQNISY